MARTEEKKDLVSDNRGEVVFFQHSGRGDGWLAGSIQLLGADHEVTRAALKQSQPRFLDRIGGTRYFSLWVDVTKVNDDVNGGKKLALRAETVIRNQSLLAVPTEAGLLMLNQVQA